MFVAQCYSFRLSFFCGVIVSGVRVPMGDPNSIRYSNKCGECHNYGAVWVGLIPEVKLLLLAR